MNFLPNTYFEPNKKNVHEVPYIQWKGRTFTQVTSAVQKNTLTPDQLYNIFSTGPSKSAVSNIGTTKVFKPPLASYKHNPLPLKHYRREIVTAKASSCNQRHSASIDEFDRPGGYLVVPPSTPVNNLGIVNTMDINLTNNTTENGTCTAMRTNGMCQDPATNALRRVRSAGMIRKTYNPSQVSVPYCTNTTQYLKVRGKQFEQNQFNYLKQGNAHAVPGSPSSADNKYAINNGFNYCPDPSNNYIPVQYKTNNYQYAQQGGVSSSARTARLNYNTITTNGGLFRTAYGSNVGTTLANGISSDTYTVKDKIGYPMNSTPVFSKTSTTPCCKKTPVLIKPR